MPGIEVLRGLAAAAVVVFHLWALGRPILFRGYWFVLGLGLWVVDIFFLLSGFLLVQYFWRPGRSASVREYYVRRVFRIVPAYYVSLAVLFLLFAERDLFNSGSSRRWRRASTSTAKEMVLYALLLLLLAVLIARRPLVAGLLLFAAAIAYRLYVALDGAALQPLFFGPVSPRTDENPVRVFIVRQFPGILPCS